MIKKIAAQFKEKIWLLLLLILLISFALRIWHLGRINEFIFDEVYFVNFAKNYLNGTAFFDIHPPLGKLILALGIKIFGDNPIGWRIMPAIFGTLLILVGYLTGKEIGGKVTGIFTAAILSLDGMLLVYSRIGLIDIFLVCFIMLSFYSFLKFSNTNKLVYIILASIFLGLGASVKYIGALIFLVFILIAFLKKVPLKQNFWKYLIFIILVPLVIYLGFFLFNFHNKDFFQKVVEWHIQSFNYNLYLTDSHPYGSKWWGWFLLLRPIWLYYKDNNGKLIGVDGIGNPLIWWSFAVVLPLLIWDSIKKRQIPLMILAGFLVFWLFWAPVKRVLFLYHALPSFTFLVLGLALYLNDVWRKPFWRTWVLVYFLILLLIFIFFLPIWIGLPLNSPALYHRLWFKSWI